MTKPNSTTSDVTDDVKVRDVDGGWAWVVLVASVLNLSLAAIFTVSVGLLQVEFVESFEGSTAFTALIGSLALSGQTLLGPVAGIVSSLLTPRISVIIGGVLICVGTVSASFSGNLITLFVFFGLVAGTGSGFHYTPSVTVISSYFHKYRLVANGICLGAPGMGVIVAPFLLSWLIENHGWRLAMVVLGCLMAQTCVLGSLFYPHDPSDTPSCGSCCRKSEPKDDPEVQSLQPTEDLNLSRLKKAHSSSVEVMMGSRMAIQMSEFGSVLLSDSVVWTVEEITSLTLRERLKHLLRRKFMWVMCLNQLLLMAGFSINTVLFPSYAQSVGVAFSDLPVLYTVYGVTMAVCRMSGGFLFSLIPNQLLKVFFCLQVCIALNLALMPLYGVSVPSLFVYKFLVGLTYGPTFLLVTPILIHYVGIQDLSVAFGLIMLCCGIGYVVAPAVGGLMYDVFGSYRVSYYIAGCTIGAAALSLLLLLLIPDLEPSVDLDDIRTQKLLSVDPRDSDGSSSQSSDNNADAVASDKPTVNGSENSVVHVISDMEDMRQFAYERHS